MGMFDYIKYEMSCPKCGQAVKAFQSKDGPRVLSTLEFWEVDSFYAPCGCGAWIEFNAPARGPRPISDYKMSVRKR